MTPEQWQKIQYFTPGEKWGDPGKMDSLLIFELDRLRKYIDQRIKIHCGYEQRVTGGFHPTGRAVDCHAENLHVMEFYIAASRFNFTGIGIYLWWDHPGLHLDTRPIGPQQERALWGSLSAKEYVPIDHMFLTQAVKIQK